MALETLAEVGFTVEAKDFAHGALVALKDAEQSRSGGFGSDDQEEHIMLSCKSTRAPMGHIDFGLIDVPLAVATCVSRPVGCAANNCQIKHITAAARI